MRIGFSTHLLQTFYSQTRRTGLTSPSIAVDFPKLHNHNHRSSSITSVHLTLLQSYTIPQSNNSLIFKSIIDTTLPTPFSLTLQNFLLLSQSSTRHPIMHNHSTVYVRRWKLLYDGSKSASSSGCSTRGRYLLYADRECCAVRVSSKLCM